MARSEAEYDVFEAAMRKLEEKGDIPLDLSPMVASVLIGQLQVALRHPGNRGESARVAALFVRRLIALLAVEAPELLPIFERGNDARYDTETPAVRGEAVVPPQKVCLCGSTKFKKEFIDANFRETMCGRIVLTVGWFGHTDGVIYTPTEDEKKMLDELHLRKIDESDQILVLNAQDMICHECKKRCQTYEGGHGSGAWSKCCQAMAYFRPYIGDSTRREVAYARAHGKRVRWLNLPCEEAEEGEGQ